MIKAMLRKFKKYSLFKNGLVFFFIFLFSLTMAFGQNKGLDTISAKSSNKNAEKLIHVLRNDYGEFIQSEGHSVQKLMYHVKLRYGSDTLYCDSAFFYVNSNSVEAFGDVAIFQADGTKAFAEYMRYTGQNRLVYMYSKNSDVALDDGKGNILWSREVYYNLSSKLGVYKRGGTLQSGATIISSHIGTYNLHTNEARFTENVVVTDPQYHIISDDLGYNTESKIVTFLGPSVVTNDASVLKTRSGFYNTLDSTAHFTQRAAIWHGQQFIEADTLDYNHAEGLAVARGSVIAMDTLEGLTLFSGIARFNEFSEILWAYHAPLLRTIHGKDSLYIKADTFFSAPIAVDTNHTTRVDSGGKSMQQTIREIKAMTIDTMALNPDDSVFHSPADSLGKTSKDTTEIIFNPLSKDTLMEQKSSKTIIDSIPLKINLKTDSPLLKITADSLMAIDSTPLPLYHQEKFDSLQLSYNNQPDKTDTSRPRYFIGYHHVWLFSDSLQGKCDSIRYNQADSLLKMFIKPLLWPNKSQVAGKIIYLKLDHSSLRKLIVPKEGILIDQSGPEKAGMFNQIQGDSITGYFKNNQLNRLIAKPHAESIYYVLNDAGEYVGCSKASSREIEIQFDTAENTIKRIYYRQNVKQTMTPMKDVMPTQMHLSRFKWQEELRPKNLILFLKGVTQPRDSEWH